MSINLEEQYDKIYKYCYFKIRNKEIAEDLTQDTFLRYFSQNSYISRGKPMAYLYTIAKNLCIDYFRQKPELISDESTIQHSESDNIITNLAVRQAINQLPTELSEILLLRYANELTVTEIAVFLKISRFAVYRKINAALREIKTKLKEEDFYE